VIAPIKKTVEGETIFVLPFPVLGKFYRVVITFFMTNPDIPEFSQVETIQAV
jgi:hypothetical protein